MKRYKNSMGKSIPDNVCLLGLLLILFGFISKNESVRIGITHWNDVNGQIESFERESFNNRVPVPCTNQSEAVAQCVGGLRALAHWLSDTTVYDESHVLHENIIRLSSCNLVGGESGWISSLEGGWEKYGQLVGKHFRPNVTTLGMKEFEGGLQQTMNYMRGLGVKVKAPANTCFQKQASDFGSEEKEFCKNYSASQRIQVLTVKDAVKNVILKIGVIGFVNPVVENLSLPGMLNFCPIVPSVQKVVDENRNDVNAFIAIGDGNLEIAKEILDKIKQVKLVIFGTGFLTEQQPFKMEQPIVYKHGYIATAGRYGSSVGHLVFDFNHSKFQLVPEASKLVETSHPKTWNAAAQAAQNDYTKLEVQIRPLKNEILAHSRVHLQGRSECLHQECNFGNLVCDAMVQCALRKHSKPFEFPVHAIYHSGAFFEQGVKAGSNVSRFDIRKWLPHHNKVHLVRIKGENLKLLFEISASALESKTENRGQFLQVSKGIEVYYSSKPANVLRIRMTHDEDGIPHLSDLLDNSDYYLVIPNFLYEGRGMFDVARQPDFWHDVIFDNLTKSGFAYDVDCIETYVRNLRQINIGLDERIWIDENFNERTDCDPEYTAETVMLTITICALCQAALYAGYSFLAMVFGKGRFSIRKKRFMSDAGRADGPDTTNCAK